MNATITEVRRSPKQPSTQTPTGVYSYWTRMLHWVSAAIILWALVTGIYAASLGEGSALRAWIGAFNVQLTTLFVPIFAVRIFNRLATPHPGHVSNVAWESLLALAGHVGLYVVTTIVLVTGVLTVDHDVSLFGLIDLQAVPMDDTFRHAWERVHRFACYGLGLMIILHLAAIVYHRRKGRNIMARMTGA